MKSGNFGEDEETTTGVGIVFGAQAAKIVSQSVYPALDRQIALVKEMRAKATRDAGVWKLPDGEAYYHDSVLTWTTSTMSPAQIHQTGLDIIKDHTAQIDAIMRQPLIAVTSSMSIAWSAPSSRSHAAQLCSLTAPSCTTSSVAASTARSAGPNPL